MIPHGVEVFLGLEPIDLRWGFDRLAGTVAERIGRDARCRALFVFFGRRRDAINVLFFDGTGMCLFYKRLGTPCEGSMWNVNLETKGREHRSRCGDRAEAAVTRGVTHGVTKSAGNGHTGEAITLRTAKAERRTDEEHEPATTRPWSELYSEPTLLTRLSISDRPHSSRGTSRGDSCRLEVDEDATARPADGDSQHARRRAAAGIHADAFESTCFNRGRHARMLRGTPRRRACWRSSRSSPNRGKLRTRRRGAVRVACEQGNRPDEVKTYGRR